MFQRQNHIPHPGPILLAVNYFGVEAAVPGDPLPLRPGLQAVHVRQEGLLGDPVLLLLDPHLLIVLLVPAGGGGGQIISRQYFIILPGLQLLLGLLSQLILLPGLLLVLHLDPLLLLLPPLHQALGLRAVSGPRGDQGDIAQIILLELEI